MKFLKKMIAAIALVPALAFASGGGFALDHAPDRSTE
jgi:ubiquinol-cytochrome c reductase cytochrome c1 subunit